MPLVPGQPFDALVGYGGRRGFCVFVACLYLRLKGELQFELEDDDDDEDDDD